MTASETAAAFQAVCVAALLLAVGSWLVQRVRWMQQLNLPPAVVGGLGFALLMSLVREQGGTPPAFDLGLQQPLMLAFFATIGFGASWSRLRQAGRAVMAFLALCSAFIVVQNLIGVALALAFGQHALFGVLTSSAALIGGPGTALAFAAAFEQHGVAGAREAGLLAAVFGIVAGGLLASPASTWLIHRHGLAPAPDAADEGRADAPDAPRDLAADAAHHAVALLLVMWAGVPVSRWIEQAGITLPAYVGTMVVAAVVRNIDDRTGWFGLRQAWMDALGGIALALFLALTIASLDLLQLRSAALPLLTILLVQTAVVIALALTIVYRMGGRDYDAAVQAGGFVGFCLGTTANALVAMRAVVERHGPAPCAFIVIPVIGACFIDLVNATVITAFLEALGR